MEIDIGFMPKGNIREEGLIGISKFQSIFQ